MKSATAISSLLLIIGFAAVQGLQGIPPHCVEICANCQDPGYPRILCLQDIDAAPGNSCHCCAPGRGDECTKDSDCGDPFLFCKSISSGFCKKAGKGIPPFCDAVCDFCKAPGADLEECYAKIAAAPGNSCHACHPGFKCFDDDDCPNPLRCRGKTSRRECCPRCPDICSPTPPCPPCPYGSHYENPCDCCPTCDGCTDDSQCPGKQHCHDGECHPCRQDCPTPRNCPKLKCKNPRRENHCDCCKSCPGCTKNRDCPKGHRCKNGICEPKKCYGVDCDDCPYGSYDDKYEDDDKCCPKCYECKKDKHCPYGHHCRRYKCVKRDDPCYNVKCAYIHCKHGSYTPKGECCPVCHSHTHGCHHDYECPEGEHCHKHYSDDGCDTHGVCVSDGSPHDHCGHCDHSHCWHMHGCYFGTGWDHCGCCEQCLVGPGDPCGGPHNIYGECGEGFHCHVDSTSWDSHGICVC